jgi:hypothetical protein
LPQNVFFFIYALIGVTPFAVAEVPTTSKLPIDPHKIINYLEEGFSK